MSALLDRTFVEAAPPNKESTTLQGWGRRPRSMVTEMTVSGIRRKCPTLLVAFFRRSAAGENTDDLQPVNLRLWAACGRCERKPLYYSS